MEFDNFQMDAAFVIKDMQNSFHLAEARRNDTITQLIEDKECTIEELSVDYDRALNVIRKEYEVRELIREKSLKTEKEILKTERETLETEREKYKKELEVLTIDFNHYQISKNSLMSWLEEYLTSLIDSKLSKKEIKKQLRNVVQHLEQREKQQP